MDSVHFLQTIFEYADTGYTQIFTLPTASATAIPVTDFTKVPAAITAGNGQDIYFSPGITEQPKNNKLSEPDIIGISSLWVDIDIFHPEAHAKKNLPRTVQEAMTLLPDTMPPSIIIHSGYGLHVYWLFRECWYFDKPEEKQQAERLLERLQLYIRQQAQANNWHIDATQDICRVMRLPRTVNLKLPQQPIMAQVIESSDIRYNPSEIEELLPAVEQTAATNTKQRTTAFERRETDGPSTYMLQNCMFMQHCQLNAKSISYGEWLAALTNIVRAVDGVAAAHQISALDPDRYDQKDCDKKIDECLLAMNPQNCEYVRTQLGFQGCPQGGCGVQAPCVWSLGKIPQARAIIKSIAVPTADTVYTPEVLGALATIQKDNPAEYDVFWQKCTGQLNKNTLKHELAQYKRENSGLTVIDGGGESAPADPDANGDRWLASVVPDVPINLKVPGSGSNYSCWIFNAKGIKLRKVTNDGGEQFQQAAYAPVIISERIYNIDTQIEKAKISFKTDFGYWRHVVLPKAAIYNTKNIVNIANSGLIVTSETARNMVKWLSSLEAANSKIIPMRQGVAKMGWRQNETEFILPGIQTQYAIDIGDDAAESTISGLGQAGDFAQWIGVMQQLRTRNKARFIMAASFAAPLLKIVGQRSFLIHNWDNTRGGKSATLHAALSVWGKPDDIAKTFDDSKTNMERTAALFTDLPLGINEYELLNERRKGEIDSTIYMISEGKGRGRGTKDGVQKTVSWRTIALMTGESQITRANSRGGIFTRLIELRGGPLADDDIFASNLYPFTARNYGYAGKLFIERLLQTDHNWLRDSYNKTRMAFRQKYPHKLESHLDALACIALADYLSSMWIWGAAEPTAGIESITMVEKIIDDLITKSEADESERAWEWLPDWLAANENRFQKRYDQKKNMMPLLGYIDNDGYNIIKTELEKALREEGFNSNKVLSAWADSGKIPCTIEKNGHRRFCTRYSTDIGEARRPYVIKIQI